jgi:hypothetical protein
MQDSQTQRQYTQQGGSGIQKTLSEQVGGQEGLGGLDEDRPSGSQPRSTRQQRG